MANPDNPRGLRPIRMLDGSPWNGQVMRCSINSATADDLFIGTPVKLAAAGGALFAEYDEPNQGGSYPGIDQADTTEVVLGVIISFEPNRSNLSSLGSLVHDASANADDRQCLVAVATPMTVFEVQGSAAMTSGLAVTGSYVDHSTESADPTAVTVSNVEVGQTGGAGWLIVGCVNRPDNDPTLANADWEVVNVLGQIGNSVAVAAV